MNSKKIDFTLLDKALYLCDSILDNINEGLYKGCEKEWQIKDHVLPELVSLKKHMDNPYLFNSNPYLSSYNYSASEWKWDYSSPLMAILNTLDSQYETLCEKRG